jgi:hypothetical protein
MATDQQSTTDQRQQEQENSNYSQGQFDQVFSQITSGQPEAIREAWQAYFDLADQTLRTARRVSEVQTLALMKDQIVSEVAQRVIGQLKQNPQLVQQGR